MKYVIYCFVDVKMTRRSNHLPINASKLTYSYLHILRSLGPEACPFRAFLVPKSNVDDIKTATLTDAITQFCSKTLNNTEVLCLLQPLA